MPRDSSKDDTILANTLNLPENSINDVARVLSPQSQYLFRGSKARLTVKSQLDHRERTDADLMMSFVCGPINVEY